METQLSVKVSPRKKLVSDVGFYAAAIAFFAVAGYCIVQILQILGVLSYPLDANLIYGFSLGIAPPYLISVIAVHHYVPNSRRIWTHIAVAFSTMYASYVSLNYVVQIATVVPATLHGTADDIRVLDQTPHSLFWDVDALGYICMGIYPDFSTTILLIALPWIITTPGSLLLLALFFRDEIKSSARHVA